MVAPAAQRNLGPILDVLLPQLPGSGDVLELASGTGQHVAAMAAHRADLTFHPTDPDPTRRASIDAWCAGLPNVRLAGDLDAVRPGWAVAASVEAVVVVNLLHLISEAEMAVLLDEAARALVPAGLLAIYGPFLRGGRATSAGDRAFDANLRRQDPDIGLKDADGLSDVLEVLGFAVAVREMPANNLMVLSCKG
jgi:SAM-dependent methyltransferase